MSNPILYFIGWLAILAGFVLTLVSWAQICSQTCADAHQFQFFGFSFETIGFLFFFTVAVLHALSLRWKSALGLELLVVAGALGAESVFIAFQWFKLDQLCPICLSIAFTVLILAIVLMWQIFQNKANRRITLMSGLKGLSIIIALIIGIVLAAIGVFKPEKTFAEGSPAAIEDPIFGNKNSPVEVFIVTDWFCPACRHMESQMEGMYPQIMEKASLMFVDKFIHPESINFTPYNLSFMINNKDKYFQLRDALTQLALKTKTPTVEQVQEAIEPLGVTYKPLNYADIDSGVRFFQGIIKTFEVTMTPTVVVANRKSLKAQKFVGGEIQIESIMQAINEMSK